MKATGLANAAGQLLASCIAVGKLSKQIWKSDRKNGGGGEGLNLGPGVLEGWFLKKPISFQDLCGFCWRSQRFVAFFFKSWNLYFFLKFFV